jgi:SNF2 family DNA or RNA helicase
MAVLHGNWRIQPQGSDFIVWADAWCRTLPQNWQETTQVNPYPYALTSDVLWEQLSQQVQWETSNQPDQTTHIIGLPTQIDQKSSTLLPVYTEGSDFDEHSTNSLSLYPWQVEGFRLTPQQTFQLLHRLPLNSLDPANSNLGADLRFWSHVHRWSLDLLARGKFLPSLEPFDAGFQAHWQPLLDSAVDQARLLKMARNMPLVCRMYQGENVKAITVNLPHSPQELLQSFLGAMIDLQVRSVAEEAERTVITNPAALQPSVNSWLHHLSAETAAISDPSSEYETLEQRLKTWVEPLQQSLSEQNLFRAGFKLNPPQPHAKEWKLEYCLQAIDDPSFIVEAETVWNHPAETLNHGGRTVIKPQETLLKGLGLATKLYPILQPSLEQACPEYCILNPTQAYEFIKQIVWRFNENGLGVILPPGLTETQGFANRLGLSLSATASRSKKNMSLGLESLLNFKWQLSIGGQTLSKSEFEKLVAKESPLVEINGEWVELRPSDIRAAKAFFESRKDKMTLTLEDALRLSTGDSQMIEKLPVVEFEAGGKLEDLLNTLTQNKALEPITTPAEFKGELRPYQARGVSWLSFLEQWGLGACLADDMGLGKCLAGSSLIFVNGELRKAEDLWNQYAGALEFDGEGFWSEPTQELLVNSIHTVTHKVTLAPIRKLYRQHIQESARRITLEDGNSITITKRHKLLTNRGWTNQLQTGDYVCVPSRLVWQGHPEDSDLVKFLAWQIAEGYEVDQSSSLTITQKDTLVLADLQQTLARLAAKNGIKINRPAIHSPLNKSSYLLLTSLAYRRYLETRGYVWGKRSAEKVIPSFIMQADIESIRLFLRYYFDAEGSAIDSMRSVEISTASPIIIQQLSVLLRRLGIWLRISAKTKCATNGSKIKRTYYFGTIGGNSLRRFAEEIGFGYVEKRLKLKAICQFANNTNVEGIPASNLVDQRVQKTKLPLRHLGMHNTVYTNGSQQFSHQSLEQVVNSISRVLSGDMLREYQVLQPSKWTNQTLQAYTKLDAIDFAERQKELQKLLDKEVFYCRIKEIEEVDYDGWVYDFEVAEHHNFVANQILCHNTIQLIAFLLSQKEKKALERPILLVCPTSVLGNWEREVKRFSPSLKVKVHHGDKREKGKKLTQMAEKQDLIVTSYALIFRDEKDLKTVNWQGIVLDEAQNIKNPEAKQTKAIRNLEADFKIALTGTPVENRLSELWSIMEFLNPGYLGQKQFFQRRFAMPIEKYGDTDSLQTLRSLVQPFILRRLKTDKDIIQDLPEKQENTVFCPLSTEQATLYQQLVDQSLADIEAAEGIQRHGMILALLTKLKQVCNHPLLLNGKSTSKTSKKSLSSQYSGKLNRLNEMLEEVIDEGDRALIFTQFAEWGKLLQPYLEQQLNRPVLFLYGATRKNKREEMIDQFQHDPQGPPIFILSLKAGGVGLNLTRANHVFHFDRWWNPAVENQATDRVFRIGQTRNVQVHKFVCTGTLEEKIHDIIESKKALAEQVVGGGEDWLTDLDTDQLRNLLILDRSSVIDDED